MRGEDQRQGAMFSYISPEARVPLDHPLRPIREMVDAALERMSERFSALYGTTGRPSIPPEKLLRALLLQVLYTVRSERLLMEQLDYNLLFRWFVGLGMDDAVWDASTFSKNRDRLLDGDIAQVFFEEVLASARDRRLLSDEHFTVDGTLVEAWAGHKSFRPKDTGGKGGTTGKNPEVDFKGKPRRNDTHESTTDPESRLYRKSPGTESKLCYQGHVLMENRNGLVVDTRLTTANGTAERVAAAEMIESVAARRSRATVGADKGYDVRSFVQQVRELGVAPHVARRDRTSALDDRTTRHAGYATSQKKRKRVEEIFGWMKTIGLMRKTRHRGRNRVDWTFTFTAAAYNLVRIRNLLPVPT